MNRQAFVFFLVHGLASCAHPTSRDSAALPDLNPLPLPYASSAAPTTAPNNDSQCTKRLEALAPEPTSPFVPAITWRDSASFAVAIVEGDGRSKNCLLDRREPNRSGVVLYDDAAKTVRAAFRGVAPETIVAKRGSDEIFMSKVLLADGKLTIGTLNVSNGCLKLGVAGGLVLSIDARVVIDPVEGRVFVAQAKGGTTRLERWARSETGPSFFVREVETVTPATPVSGIAFDADTNSVVLRSRDIAYVFDASTFADKGMIPLPERTTLGPWARPGHGGEIGFGHGPFCKRIAPSSPADPERAGCAQWVAGGLVLANLSSLSITKRTDVPNDSSRARATSPPPPSLSEDCRGHWTSDGSTLSTVCGLSPPMLWRPERGPATLAAAPAHAESTSLAISDDGKRYVEPLMHALVVGSLTTPSDKWSTTLPLAPRPKGALPQPECPPR